MRSSSAAVVLLERRVEQLADHLRKCQCNGGGDKEAQRRNEQPRRYGRMRGRRAVALVARAALPRAAFRGYR